MSFIVRLIKFTFLLFVLCAGAYFVLFNGSNVELSFGHLGQVVMPAAVVYIIFYFLGAATVSLFFGYEFTRRSLKLGSLERKVRKIQGSSEERPHETDASIPKTYL